MRYVYKLLHIALFYKCNFAEFGTVSSNIHNTRQSRRIYFKLKKTHVHLIIRLNHFVIRSVNNWNLLNDNILRICLRNLSYHLINLFLEGMF